MHIVAIAAYLALPLRRAIKGFIVDEIITSCMLCVSFGVQPCDWPAESVVQRNRIIIHH